MASTETVLFQYFSIHWTFFDIYEGELDAQIYFSLCFLRNTGGNTNQSFSTFYEKSRFWIPSKLPSVSRAKQHNNTVNHENGPVSRIGILGKFPRFEIRVKTSKLPSNNRPKQHNKTLNREFSEYSYSIFMRFEFGVNCHINFCGVLLFVKRDHFQWFQFTIGYVY